MHYRLPESGVGAVIGKLEGNAGGGEKYISNSGIYRTYLELPLSQADVKNSTLVFALRLCQRGPI